MEGAILNILKSYKTYLQSFSLKFQDEGELSGGGCSMALAKVNETKKFNEIFLCLTYKSKNFKTRKNFLLELKSLETATKPTRLEGEVGAITELVNTSYNAGESDFRAEYNIKIIFKLP